MRKTLSLIVVLVLCSYVSAQGYADTLVLTGVDFGESIGEDLERLISRHLTSLGEGVIRTGAQQTVYRQHIELANGFTGGVMAFDENEEDEVGHYLRFAHNDPLFSYTLQFDPSLEGEIIDGRVDDLEGQALEIMGEPSFITSVDVSGSTVRIGFFTSHGELVVQDDVSDTAYSGSVEINGQNIEADCRIQGRVDGDTLRISDIVYRPMAISRGVGDVYVRPYYGVRGQLRDPEVLLSREFDIIYGGLEDRVVGDSPRGYSGEEVQLLPGGGDSYDLIFTNNQGTTYRVPVYQLNGAIKLGDNNHDLLVTEATNSATPNIDEGDYFIVSSGEDLQADTHVLRFDSAQNGDLFVSDLNGEQMIEAVDASGSGVISVGGRSYAFSVTGDSIAVDQNADGDISSDTVRATVRGGVQLELSTTGMDIIVPRKLFSGNRPSSDEVVSIRVVDDDGDIDLLMMPQTELDIEGANPEIGLNSFGVAFIHNEQFSPSSMNIIIPRVQGSNRQATGWFVITTKRSNLI